MNRYIHLNTKFVEMPKGDPSIVAVYDTKLDFTMAAMNAGDGYYGRREGALKIVDQLNQDKYLGLGNWQLWSAEEGFGTADRTKFNPAVDTTELPWIKPDWYHARNPVASGHEVGAWFVDLGHGEALVYLGYFVGYVLVAVPGRPPVAGQ
jgi:hypothetical protein